MSSLIQLARYRSVSRRDLPLGISAGDADLRPVSVLLWLGSAARAVLAFVHKEEFGAEASLALMCVVLLPLLMFSMRRARGAARQ